MNTTVDRFLKYRDDPEMLLVLYRNIKSLKEERSEILAKELCKDIKEKFDELNYILPLIRTNLDKNSPDGYIKKDYREDDSTRKGVSSTGKEHVGRNNEKHVAMQIFKQSNPTKYSHIKISGLGYIIDYETPIGGNLDHLSRDGDPVMIREESKNICHRYSPGKCDLLSYNPKEDRIYILELKDQDSKEPLLSAVVEAYTYCRIIDRKALLENMMKLYPDFGINKDTKVFAAPLIYRSETNVQYKQLSGKNVSELINLLGESVFAYSEDNAEEIKVEKIM